MNRSDAKDYGLYRAAPDETWGKTDVDAYMALVPHKDGMALLSMDELRNLLMTLWVCGKED